MAYVEERVNRLEDVVQEFITNVGIEFNKLYNSQMRTEAELRAFKEEMKAFKEEMKAFKEEMKAFKDEMKAFKDEMKAFKDEMKEFKEESRRQTREMNRQWGELANKLGTMVEYLVAPSLSRIIREVLDRDVIDLSVRRKRKLPDGRVHEYDAIAVTEDVVCLNSTKSTLRSADVDQFKKNWPGCGSSFPSIGIRRWSAYWPVWRWRRAY